MISENTDICPKCGGKLRYYDGVKRLVRTKNGKASRTDLRRLRCLKCGSVHREIPPYIFPYKQYTAEIIIGVLEGLITSDTLEYEDRPCEMTMMRWRSQKMHILL